MSRDLFNELDYPGLRKYSLQSIFMRYSSEHDQEEYLKYTKLDNTMDIAKWMLDQFRCSPTRIVPYDNLPEFIKTRPNLDIKRILEYGYTCGGYKYPSLHLTESQFWELEKLFSTQIKQYLDIGMSSLMKYTSSGEFGSVMGLNGFGFYYNRGGNVLKLRQYFEGNTDMHIV